MHPNFIYAELIRILCIAFVDQVPGERDPQDVAEDDGGGHGEEEV